MGSGFTPAPLHIWSNNARGLNAPERRSHILRSLWSEKVSIAFLQETHFLGDRGPSLRDSRFPLGYFANHPTTKRAGVAILLARTVPFVCTGIESDPMGRFIFIKGSIAECIYTFACVYAPNIHQRKFLRQTLTKLERFREGFLIMAGDLNVALEPGTDTSRGVSAFSPHGLRSIRNGLRDAGLVDAWRALHPCDTDFTYYSTVHKRYSRLDYVFLAQELLPMLLSADIRPMGWSDHSPVSVQIRSPLFRPTGRQWRMNESILTDVPIAADI
ncbi:Hypothetical predicted protein, partial [Pelobates cultripes]